MREQILRIGIMFKPLDIFKCVSNQRGKASWKAQNSELRSIIPFWRCYADNETKNFIENITATLK